MEWTANWAVKGKGPLQPPHSPGHRISPDVGSGVAGANSVSGSRRGQVFSTESRYGSAGLIVFAPNAVWEGYTWGRTEECFGEDAFLDCFYDYCVMSKDCRAVSRYWKSASLMIHFLANSNENNRNINSSDSTTSSSGILWFIRL